MKTQRPNKRRWHSGVTLIELLMTLAIAAILLTIAVPSFQAVMSTNRIASVTNELVRALQLARSEAVTRGTRVSICKTSDPGATSPTCDTTAAWQDGWLVFVDESTEGTFDSGTDTILRVGAPQVGNVSDFEIDPASTFSNYISFLPGGESDGANFANGSFCVRIPPDERRIVINVTGRVRTEQDCP